MANLKGCGRKLGPYDCCTVVCGDCLVLMRDLPDGYVDAVITDPPYGTGWVRGGGAVGVFNARHERPNWDVFSVDWIRPSLANRWAVFAPKSRAAEIGACFQNPGIMHYRKTNPRPNGPACEAVVLSFIPWEAEILECVAYNGDTPLHPCQKPEEVMEWLISEVDAETILDPFLGSGTTAVAAKKLGRHFLGFEISPEYCKIANERIALVEAQPNLFEPKPEQLEFVGASGN